MNTITLDFHQSFSGSLEESDELIDHTNEPTVVGLIFELKEEVDDTVNILGFRASAFNLICGLWVLVSAAFRLHWFLQTLNILRTIVSLFLSYLLANDVITAQQRCRILQYYLSFSLMMWCLWTGGLQSIFICNFIFHPMQVAFKWEYTRMFLFYLSVLYCFEVLDLVPVALHDTTNTPWWGTYFFLGFLMYFSYFVGRLRSYVANHELRLPPTQRVTRSGGTVGTRRMVPAELNYAACFVGFGMLWSCCWFLFFAHLDNRMNYVNLCYLLVVLVISWGYYDLRIRAKAMRLYAFCALMTLFMLYCLLSGGTNSPFFILLISVASFFHANTWKLQFSFGMFFMVYSSSFVLPKSTQTKLASCDLDSIYRLSFMSVMLLLAVLYIFYPQSRRKRRALDKNGAPKSPEKTIMIQAEPLVIDRTRKLGRGTFGVVYAGKFGVHERVAIKVLPTGSREGSHGELKFVGQHKTYSCENVVKYYAYHTDDISKKHYIVMERCDCDLEKFLRDQARELTLPLAIAIMKDVLTGLKYVHGIGLLHRDLKSAKILLSKVPKEDGSYVAKLTGFGSSIAQQGSANTMASLCKARGSLIYLAPEIFAASREDGEEFECMATELSDVYSVGIVMWELFNTLALRCFSSPYSLKDLKVVKGTADGNENQFILYCALSKHVAKGHRPKIAKGFSTKFTKLFIHCVQPSPCDRPTVSQLIAKVEKYSKIPEERMELTTEEILVKVKRRRDSSPKDR